RVSPGRRWTPLAFPRHERERLSLPAPSLLRMGTCAQQSADRFRAVFLRRSYFFIIFSLTLLSAPEMLSGGLNSLPTQAPCLGSPSPISSRSGGTLCAFRRIDRARCNHPRAWRGCLGVVCEKCLSLSVTLIDSPRRTTLAPNTWGYHPFPARGLSGRGPGRMAV